jgi:hypothetical protein
MCVRAAITSGTLPSDTFLGQQLGLGERSVRSIRLAAGLDRRDIAAWLRQREPAPAVTASGDFLCSTPYAGLWLLVPLIIQSALLPAARMLEWTSRTSVTAASWVLTILMWAILGFRRFSHLDDFRHQADLGLALFNGRMRLLADSTVGRLIHTLTPASAEQFYLHTAAPAVPQDVPDGAEWLSLDEHVVGVFTKLQPRPLGKTRVPTRGRSYPAIRLYAPFHLWAGRFVGLVVTEAKRALSQVVPTLIADLRRVREQAQHPQPQQVDLIIDRGGYKGRLFETLIDDGNVRFIAMARATKPNLAQWEAVAATAFTPYQPEGESNPNLLIAETTTSIPDCRHPIRTVLIRDQTPNTRQRWRALFTNVPATRLVGAAVDATYRTRQRHEQSFADLDHHLSGKRLPKAYRLERVVNAQGERRTTVATSCSEESMTGLKVVAWLRHWAYNLVKDFGAALSAESSKMEVGTLVRKYIARPGVLRIEGRELWVSLAPFSGWQVLTEWIAQINQQRIAIPWLDHLILQIEVAPVAMGVAANPSAVRRTIFANRQPDIGV